MTKFDRLVMNGAVRVTESERRDLSLLNVSSGELSGGTLDLWHKDCMGNES